jgi:hypothetical protein
MASIKSDSALMRREMKIFVLATISLIVAVALMLSSLNFMTYSMASNSEEAAVADWGYPLPMVETGPFYGGYVGQLIREGGREYVLSQTGLHDDPKILWSGVILNFLCYSYIGLLVVAAFVVVTGKAKTLINESA